MSETTYIKLFRKMLTWEWYKDGNTLRVFLHILLRANYEPSVYKGHEIGAGECVFGYRSWAKQLGMSVQNVRTAIGHLQSTREITLKPTHQFTIIHVEKWDFWQLEDGLSNTLVNTTSKRKVTQSKEYKNIYTTPNIEEVRSYVAEKNLCVDADYFFQYYETAEWTDNKGKPVKNWKLKCLTWHRRNSNENKRTDNRTYWETDAPCPF